MPLTNQKRFPTPVEPGSIDSTKDENTKSPVLLSPKDVASRLGVCSKTALSIMKELPHVSISKDMYSGKNRIRITEKTLVDFENGIITRKRLRRTR